MDQSLYAGVPQPVDLFAADDAIDQLTSRLAAAGYKPEYAPVKAAYLVRQILRAWGVPIELPESALLTSSPEGFIAGWEALELRRARVRPWPVEGDSEIGRT